MTVRLYGGPRHGEVTVPTVPAPVLLCPEGTYVVLNWRVTPMVGVWMGSGR